MQASGGSRRLRRLRARLERREGTIGPSQRRDRITALRFWASVGSVVLLVGFVVWSLKSRGNDNFGTQKDAFQTWRVRGVAAAMNVAKSKFGYDASNKTWVNLGRGAPETGNLPGQPSRSLVADKPWLSYPPPSGIYPLRAAIAAYYNDLYRASKVSKYAPENVLVCAGGRNAILRVFASLDAKTSVVGMESPDYPAYVDFVELFRLKSVILNRRRTSNADVIIRSNPGNPTARVLRTGSLKQMLQEAKDTGTTIVLDEFYSHYVYSEDESNSVSGAKAVEDVNKDNVLLINGLTKNFRMPGVRIGWIVGPEHLIAEISKRAMFLDGGANHYFQHVAVPLLEPSFAKRDMAALQRHFRKKRDFVVARLNAIGIRTGEPPEGTFYIFADVSGLPPPLNDSEQLFLKLLERGVIVVPGIYFSLESSTSAKRGSMLRSAEWLRRRVRFSFGPRLEDLARGLDILSTLVSELN